MRRFARPVLVLALALVPALPAAADTARLLADLATGSEVRGSGQGPVVVLDQPEQNRQLAFYAADDGRHGMELWVTIVEPLDFTTRMVADLCPGPCSSDPRALAVAGDRLFFQAHDGVYPLALFTSRGDDVSTERLHELVEPRLGDFATEGVSYAGHYLFPDVTVGGCYAIWASDGTRAGTRVLEAPCPREDVPHQLVPTPLGVYFKAANGLYTAQRNLNDADGFRVRSILGCPSFCSSAEVGDYVEGLNGRMIFARNFPGALYSSQGNVVETLHLFGPGSYVSGLQRYGDKVLFQVAGGAQATFWETDGTAAGTKPSAALAFAKNYEMLPRSAGDPVVLLYDPVGRKLHATNLVESRVLILDTDRPQPILDRGVGQDSAFHLGDSIYLIDPALGLRTLVGQYSGAGPTSTTLPRGGDTIFRLAGEFGFEPTVLIGGGSLDTALVLRDIAQDSIESSSPRPAAARDAIVALLGDGRVARVDEGGVTMVDHGSYSWLAATGGKLFLHSRDEHLELAVTTGAAPLRLGLEQVATLDTNRPGVHDGKVYLTTYHPGQDIHVSDGTATGTRELYDSHPGWDPVCQILCPPWWLDHYPNRIAADDQHLFWSGFRIAFGWELFTARLGEAQFALRSAPHGTEARLVWRGKGYFTTPEAVWVQGLEGGAATQLIHLPVELPLDAPFVGVGDHVFFVVRTLAGQQLWRTDGTTLGTAQVALGVPAERLAFGEMLAAGARLYLSVAEPLAGPEPWVIEGAEARRLGDLYPGARGSHPSGFYALADGRVVFSADDGVAGAEPWVTGGTAASTRRLVDLAPGASGPQFFAERAGRLVFSADDGEHGRELFELVEGSFCPEDRLCLHDDRFEVTALFSAQAGSVTGFGQRALSSSESGVFTFFSADNWELQVKVLDGCALNDRFWVFGAATTNVGYAIEVKDRATNQTRTYTKTEGPLASAITDTDAFATCDASPPAPRYEPAPPGAEPSRLCPGDPASFCFGDYRVSVTWETPTGETGIALPTSEGSSESGLLTFFSPDNWEMMVKLLDGCGLNGHRWLFAAASTDVGWTLTLERRDGSQPPKVYRNTPGVQSPATADTSAMPCSP